MPFSPVMSTEASEGPMRLTISITWTMAWEAATMAGAPSRRIRFSASRRRLFRRAAASSRCVRRVARSRAFSQGFCTKSLAPRRMASTARSMLPQAVMTITGRPGSRAWMPSSRARPSWPDVVSWL